MENTIAKTNSYAANISAKVQALETSKEYLAAERAVRATAENVRNASAAYDTASAANDADRLANVRKEIVLAWVAHARAWNVQAALCRSAGFNYADFVTLNLVAKASLWNLLDLVPADLR